MINLTIQLKMSFVHCFAIDGARRNVTLMHFFRQHVDLCAHMLEQVLFYFKSA